MLLSPLQEMSNVSFSDIRYKQLECVLQVEMLRFHLSVLYSLLVRQAECTPVSEAWDSTVQTKVIHKKESKGSLCFSHVTVSWMIMEATSCK